MNYALIENNIVTNIIWLYPTTAMENAVALNDRPVAIGDTYSDGKFYRDGVEVLSGSERLADALAALETLGYTEV